MPTLNLGKLYFTPSKYVGFLQFFLLKFFNKMFIPTQKHFGSTRTKHDSPFTEFQKVIFERLKS